MMRLTGLVITAIASGWYPDVWPWYPFVFVVTCSMDSKEPTVGRTSYTCHDSWIKW